MNEPVPAAHCWYLPKEPNAHIIQLQWQWASPMLLKLNFTSEVFELITHIPAVVQSLGLLD